MAIGTPVQHASVANDGTSVTTGSFTPTAGSRLFAFANGFNSPAPATAPTVSDSLGGTWTLIQDDTFDYTASRDVHSALYYQDIGGSPSAMTVTASSTGALETTVSVQDVSGSAASFTNRQFNGSNTGDPAFTLSAVGGTSAVMVWVTASMGNNSFTITGFTKLQDATISTPGGDDYRHLIAYDLSSPSNTPTITSNNSRAGGYAMELVEAGGGVTGVKFNNTPSFATAVVTTGAVNVTGVLFAATNSFHTAVVGQGQTVTGSLFADPDTFGAAKVSYTILATRYNDSDSFGAGTVTRGAVGVQGTLYVDPDIFYNGSISGGTPPTPGTGAGVLLRRRRR